MPAVQLREFGGPEVLELVDVERSAPGPGEVGVEIEAAGVNYRDLNELKGSHGPAPRVVGIEAAGIVASLGEGVSGVSVGDRVAWVNVPASFASWVVAPVESTIPVPSNISGDTAAAVVLQGMTAHYLATDAFPVKPGDWALVQAAAGGVGQLLTQIIKIRGGHVIGTVSTDAKAELARAAGADQVIRYDREEVAPRVRELTGGEGVAVVFDGVGKSTFDGSLHSLRRRGTLVSCGAASGPVPPLDLRLLNDNGSLYVTRTTGADFRTTREELIGRTNDLFEWIASGQLHVHVGKRYPLAEAAQALSDIASRNSAGKLLLLP